MKKMKFKGFDSVLVKTKYDDGSLKLLLVEENTPYISPLTVVTANLGTPGLEDNQAFVKDYSENSGMLDCLKKAGLVKNVITYFQSEFVTFPLVEFNLDDVLTMDEFKNVNDGILKK